MLSLSEFSSPHRLVTFGVSGAAPEVRPHVLSLRRRPTHHGRAALGTKLLRVEEQAENLRVRGFQRRFDAIEQPLAVHNRDVLFLRQASGGIRGRATYEEPAAKALVGHSSKQLPHHRGAALPLGPVLALDGGPRCGRLHDDIDAPIGLGTSAPTNLVAFALEECGNKLLQLKPVDPIQRFSQLEARGWG